VHHLSLAQQKTVYDTHQNDSSDVGYLRFLSAALEPVAAHLNPGSKALDYGSGPGPALGKLLADFGIETRLYDPIYEPDCPKGPFELIFSTETFEHFPDPAGSIRDITGLLKPAGLLTIMTQQWTDAGRFGSWSYTRDRTHVCFYHTRTFQWIAGHFGYDILYNDGRRVVSMRKRMHQ
jgi:hypothetical protein